MSLRNYLIEKLGGYTVADMDEERCERRRMIEIWRGAFDDVSANLSVARNEIAFLKTAPAAQVVVPTKRTVENRGRMLDVYRRLAKGGATAEMIASELSMPREIAQTVLGAMRRDGYVHLTATGYNNLTSWGIARANWAVANPTRKGFNKASRRAAAGVAR